MKVGLKTKRRSFLALIHDLEMGTSEEVAVLIADEDEEGTRCRVGLSVGMQSI